MSTVLNWNNCKSLCLLQQTARLCLLILQYLTSVLLLILSPSPGKPCVHILFILETQMRSCDLQATLVSNDKRDMNFPSLNCSDFLFCMKCIVESTSLYFLIYQTVNAFGAVYISHNINTKCYLRTICLMNWWLNILVFKDGICERHKCKVMKRWWNLKLYLENLGT